MGIFQNNLMGAAAAAASAGGGDFYSHQIANSCRFIGSVNDSGTNFMYHTRGTPTNVDKCTISAWVKRSELGSKDQMFTGSGLYGGNYSWLGFNTANEFYFHQAGSAPQFESNALFRDTNAWMHIVIANDSTQGTAANRNKIYINGVQYTDWGDSENYSALNGDFYMNTSGYKLFVGSGGASEGNSWLPYEGLIAEYVFIDGTQYAASDFGETKNGVWIPKDPSGLTFGNNGAYLKFESSGDLGNDSSGNNNDFTVTAIAAHDQMLDSPTFNSDSNGGNFATLGPLWKTDSITFAEGNLAWSGSANERGMMSNWAIPIGTKAYFEYYASAWAGGTADTQVIGINQAIANLIGGDRGGKDKGYAYQSGNGYKQILTANSAYGYAWTTGDVIGVAVDRVNHTINFYANGGWQGTFSISSTMELFPFIGNGGGTNVAGGYINFGQDGTFAGTKTAGGNSDDTGYGNFFYDVPAGFLAMCSGNLPTADAIDPAQTDDNYPQKLFAPKLYTGDGASTLTISGMDFKPDFTWIKARNDTSGNKLFDSTRGVTKYLASDSTAAEVTASNTLKSWTSDGFTLGDESGVNYNSSTNYLSWNWRANGGTTSSNATGDITSTVQADPSGGFSIFTYTGSGTSGNTVAHGLSQAPTMTIIKQRNSSNGWNVWATGYNNGDYDSFAELNTTGAWLANQGGSGPYTAAPGATLLTLTSYGQVNNSGSTYVGYAFSDIEGYCKSGSYVGNGSGTDGTFVYTGFRPAFLMVKKTTINNWRVQDNTRDPYNPAYHMLVPNSDAAEDAYTDGTDYNDFLSNGFKLARGGDAANWNASGATYVYLAMAHNPFKYATAR